MRHADELLASGPAALHVAGAREAIRDRMRETRTKLVVLDDDPTGSQSVQHVPVLTGWSEGDVEWAFSQPVDVFFILTNTRSLGERDTTEVLREVLATVDRVASRLGDRYVVVSRSDSTLRGHFPLETDVLSAFAAERGRPYDAVLISPAYFEAGRVTSDDVHYVRDGDLFLPVASTDYAHDATFGFHSSDLRGYVEEKTRGRVRAADVISVSLDDIRHGGSRRVAEILRRCENARPVVVNAVVEADLEVVALGTIDAEDAGTRILYRTGPSFVPIRAGLEARPPVTHAEIFPGGKRPGRGLVVVGSHVELTNLQVSRLLELEGITRVELDVPGLLDPARHTDVVRRTGEELVAALRQTDTVLVTSRSRVTGSTAVSSLHIARQVSASVVTLVKQARTETALGWVIAKGGITSSDVATAGLGIRRAHVLGQLFPSIVSVWAPDDGGDGDEARAGLPYVVFAGNVGDADSLADAVRILRGGPGAST